MSSGRTPEMVGGPSVEVPRFRRSSSRDGVRVQIFQVIWLPWIFLFALKLVAPMEFSNDLLYAYLCVAGSVLFWSLAAFNSTFDPIEVVVPLGQTSQLLLVTWALFLIFVPLTYFDFFIADGRSILTVVEDRERQNVAGRGASALGGIIAILTATPVVLIVMRRVLLGARRARFVNFLILAVAIPTLLFSGGRNPLILSLLFLFIARRLMTVFDPPSSREGAVLRALRRNIVMGVVGGAVLFYIGYVSVTRRDIQGTLHEYAAILTQSYGVRLTPLFDALERIDTGISVAYANLYYYIQHPVSILGRLFEMSDIGTGGYSTFPLYTFILEYLMGADFVSEFDRRVPFRGSYTTFWGPLYQDGGFVVVVLGTALIGAFFMYLMRVRNLGPGLVLITSGVLLTVAVAPIYGLTSTGFGSSLIFVIILVSLVGSISLKGSRQ